MSPLSNAFYLAALLASVPAASLAQDEACDDTPTFTLSVAAANDDAIVDVTLIRIAPGLEVDNWSAQSLGLYDITIKRENKILPPGLGWSALQRFRRLDTQAGLLDPIILTPGKPATTRIDLRPYFDLSQPGEYEVTASRRIASPWSSCTKTISSKPARIVIGRSKDVADTPFSLSIKPSDADPGVPDVILIDRRNESNQNIIEDRCWAGPADYTIHVLRNGQALNPNSEWWPIGAIHQSGYCPGSDTLVTIKSHESDIGEFAPSQFFDLSAPGTYVLWVTYEPAPWLAIRLRNIESNHLTFEVGNDGPEQVQTLTP